MERILVIGSGGAGKSTLARLLGQCLDLPVVHLDRMFWYGNWQHLPRPEFSARLAAELAKPRWIIDGNYNATLPQRLARCDTVLLLDYSTFTCLWGAVRRIAANYGRVRPDMGGQCVEHFDPTFLRWVAEFRKKERPKILAELAQAGPAVKIYTFRNRRQAQKFMDSCAASIKI